MLEWELWQLILVGSVCLFAGLVDAIAGGGGLLTVPMYIGIGLNPQQTLGTNKMASTIGTSIAVLRYLRTVKLHGRIALALAFCGFLGGAAGAALSDLQTRLSMLIFLLVLVPVIFALQPIQDARARRPRTSEQGIFTSWRTLLGCLSVAFVIGAYDGFFGPGTGTLLILGFILLGDWGYRDAAIYGRLVNLCSNLGALTVFGWRGSIIFSVVTVAVAGSVIGNWLGSGLAIKNAESIIRPAFRFVLALLLLQAAYEVWNYYF